MHQNTALKKHFSFCHLAEVMKCLIRAFVLKWSGK